MTLPTFGTRYFSGLYKASELQELEMAALQWGDPEMRAPRKTEDSFSSATLICSKSIVVRNPKP